MENTAPAVRDLVVTVERAGRARSKLPNDPMLLPGVDRRSREGRRYQDMVYAAVQEFPGANPVAIRELVALQFTLEREQGAVVSGSQPDLEGIVRLTHAIERKLRTLRAAQRKRANRPPSLADYLASQAGDRGAP
jgi:hypothetical protein